MPHIPRSIPERLADDRAVRALVTQWRNCHARHRVCRRRVYWGNALATKIEKKRRKEKWELVARILEIERTLLRFVAKSTHHPEIWSSKKRKRDSTLRTLNARYIQHRYAVHHLTGRARVTGMRELEAIVAKIRKLERAWMVELMVVVLPDEHIPDAIPLHPRELRPRKLKSASKRLQQEVA